MMILYKKEIEYISINELSFLINGDLCGYRTRDNIIQTFCDKRLCLIVGDNYNRLDKLNFSICFNQFQNYIGFNEKGII